MPTNWPTYAWYTTAALLGALGLYLLIQWLIGDRSKGRRRCPKCWYDMSATPGLTCPECGRTAPSDRRLYRTRRPPKVLIGAVLCLTTAYAAVIVPRAVRDGWRSAIPTTLLLLVVRDLDHNDAMTFAVGRVGGLAPRPTRSLAEELLFRYLQGPMWRWQWRWVVKKQGLAATAQIELFTRGRCAAGAEMCVCFNWKTLPTSMYLLMLHVNRTVTLTPQFSNATPVRVATNDLSVLRPSSVGIPPTDASEVKFDILVEETVRWSKRPIVISRQSVRVPIEIVPTEADVIESVDSDRVTKDIDNSLQLAIGAAPAAASGPHLTLLFNPPPSASDIGIVMQVEILHGSTIVAAERVYPRTELEIQLPWISALARQTAVDDSGLWINPQDPSWTIRMTGVTHVVSCGCNPAKQWTGSFERSLRSVLVPSAVKR